MRTGIFGGIARLSSSILTATIVVCFIADDLLDVAGKKLRERWEYLSDKRVKLTKQDIEEIEARAEATCQANKDLPLRPGMKEIV